LGDFFVYKTDAFIIQSGIQKKSSQIV